MTLKRLSFLFLLAAFAGASIYGSTIAGYEDEEQTDTINKVMMKATTGMIG